MNPKTLGKLANHRQRPWKAPLPIFIEDIYLKRFGKVRPEEVLTIRQVAEKQQAKKRAKKAGETREIRRETVRDVAGFIGPGACSSRLRRRSSRTDQRSATRRMSLPMSSV